MVYKEKETDLFWIQLKNDKKLFLSIKNYVKRELHQKYTQHRTSSQGMTLLN